MQTMTIDSMALTLGDCTPVVSPEALVAAYHTEVSIVGHAMVLSCNYGCNYVPRGTIVEITRDKYAPSAYLMLTLFETHPSLLAIAQSACLVDNLVVVPDDDAIKDFMLAIVMLASCRTYPTSGNCPLSTTACFLISKMFLNPSKYLHYSADRFAEKQDRVHRIQQEVEDIRRQKYPVVFRPDYAKYYPLRVCQVVWSFMEYYTAEPLLDRILEALPHVFAFLVDMTTLANAPDLAHIELWLER
jgi:hypothetical protein